MKEDKVNKADKNNKKPEDSMQEMPMMNMSLDPMQQMDMDQTPMMNAPMGNMPMMNMPMGNMPMTNMPMGNMPMMNMPADYMAMGQGPIICCPALANSQCPMVQGMGTAPVMPNQYMQNPFIY